MTHNDTSTPPSPSDLLRDVYNALLVMEPSNDRQRALLALDRFADWTRTKWAEELLTDA